MTNSKCGNTLFLVMFAAVVLLCTAGLRAQSPSASLPPVTPIEAVHLAEAQVPRLATLSVRAELSRDVPVYIVEGTVQQDGYQAVVDASLARVLRVTKNGAPHYDWQGVAVIAHRGASQFAPENTIAAFEKAIEWGADLIEIDIRETKDGHLVVIHDATVDRTTDGTGAVTDLTLAELKKLDAGSWFGPEFNGEKIPTLDEALTAMKGRSLADLDFKAGTPEKLVDAVRRHGLLGKLTLYAGDQALLRKTLEISKEFHARPSVYAGRAGLPILLRELNAPIVNIDWPQFSEGLIRDIHLAGRQAFVNTMGPNDNHFGILAAIEAGADYVQTDRLDVLVPLLRARGWQRRSAGRPLVSQR